MFGSIMKAATKVVSAPLDIADIGLDIATGGNGRKASRRDSLLSPLVEMRDDFADSLEELDED